MEHALEGLLLAFAGGFDELALQGAAGHADGALDDGDVVFRGVDIGFLEADVGIAFLGGHEAGGHLHAGSAELYHLGDVFAAEHPAAADDGDGAAGLVFKELIVNMK